MADRAVLKVRGGRQNGRNIDLFENRTLTMGRSDDNDIVVDEPLVSRQHAGIRGDRNGYWLQDLDSRNGTFINGEPVEGEGVRLRDSDLITLGGADASVQWVFRELGATATFQRPSV